MGPALTQLSVNARYQPPLAMVGRLLDRTLLNRVREAGISDVPGRGGAAVRAALLLSHEVARARPA